jgi:hypothetical protein
MLLLISSRDTLLEEDLTTRGILSRKEAPSRSPVMSNVASSLFIEIAHTGFESSRHNTATPVVGYDVLDSY